MHRVEIRLTNEGTESPSANFEVYTETLKDGQYIETQPGAVVAGGGAPIIQFLEDNERIIVVAKANTGRLVYDKDQNANIRVETEEEVKRREDREANVAKSQADQAVRNAEARVGEAKDSAKNAEDSANAEVKHAEANRAKLEADQAKNRAAASEQIPAGNATTTTSTKDQNPTSGPVSAVQPGNRPAGNPASANTGPIDSKQIKAEASTQGPTPVKNNG